MVKFSVDRLLTNYSGADSGNANITWTVEVVSTRTLAYFDGILAAFDNQQINDLFSNSTGTVVERPNAQLSNNPGFGIQHLTWGYRGNAMPSMDSGACPSAP